MPAHEAKAREDHGTVASAVVGAHVYDPVDAAGGDQRKRPWLRNATLVASDTAAATTGRPARSRSAGRDPDVRNTRRSLNGCHVRTVRAPRTAAGGSALLRTRHTGGERTARRFPGWGDGQGTMYWAARNSSYHSARVRGTSDPRAASATRCGLVVPMTTCIRAGWRVIQAVAMARDGTP